MHVPQGHWLLGHIPALLKDPLSLLDQCDGGVVPLRLGRRAWLILDPPDALHVLQNSEFVYSKGRAFRYGKKLNKKFSCRFLDDDRQIGVWRIE